MKTDPSTLKLNSSLFYLHVGESTEPCVLTQVRRSTRKTPNKYRRKSTVSRDSTSEENETPVTVQPNKVVLPM